NTVLPLNGTGEGEKDPGLLLALAKFGSAPCIVLGQDRFRQDSRAPLGPAALREARRGMRLAAELHLPLVTVIDTPGAALSQSAEEGGIAGEIARSLAELANLDAPSVSLILGEGSGGGALALIPTDRVLSAEHGWLSPLPPEGASAIVHRTTERARSHAQSHRSRRPDHRRTPRCQRRTAGLRRPGGHDARIRTHLAHARTVGAASGPPDGSLPGPGHLGELHGSCENHPLSRRR